jgi:hypothetical protein
MSQGERGRSWSRDFGRTCPGQASPGARSLDNAREADRRATDFAGLRGSWLGSRLTNSQLANNAQTTRKFVVCGGACPRGLSKSPRVPEEWLRGGCLLGLVRVVQTQKMQLVEGGSQPATARLRLGKQKAARLGSAPSAASALSLTACLTASRTLQRWPAYSVAADAPATICKSAKCMVRARGRDDT